MQPVSSFSAIASRYDALLLDLWGVVHDGSHLYPGVKEALDQLKKNGKKVIFISNAPRRAEKVAVVLRQLGIEPSEYGHVISSGEAGYQWLAAGKCPWGKRYYYIGPSKDADVLNGLDYQRVDDVKQADFVLNVGFGSEEQTTQEFDMLLRAAKAQKLPMLCLNPDMEVVKQTGERFPCAGVLAKAYERMGGEVTWFGKPYAAVYEHCKQWLEGIPKARILAVGDSLETDIRGAQDFGIDSMLVTGGILKKNKPAEIEAMCAESGIRPVYIAPQLLWQQTPARIA
jgi:HAD superfamily hydrolase (TIGR01459 family)